MKTIVIVEDNPVAAGIYRSLLAGQGFTVEVAADGEAGVEAVRRVRPDLVLLDLVLPKIDGAAVLRQIRATPETAATPVVLISNAYNQSRIDELWAAGATLVLTDGGGPGAKQRGLLNEVLNERSTPVAVISTNLAVRAVTVPLSSPVMRWARAPAGHETRITETRTADQAAVRAGGNVIDPPGFEAAIEQILHLEADQPVTLRQPEAHGGICNPEATALVRQGSSTSGESRMLIDIRRLQLCEQAAGMMILDSERYAAGGDQTRVLRNRRRHHGSLLPVVEKFRGKRNTWRREPVQIQSLVRFLLLLRDELAYRRCTYRYVQMSPRCLGTGRPGIGEALIDAQTVGAGIGRIHVVEELIETRHGGGLNGLVRGEVALQNSEGRGAQQAGDGLEQGGLAGAVRPQHRHDLPREDLQRDPGQGVDAVEVERLDALHGQQRVGGVEAHWSPR